MNPNLEPVEPSVVRPPYPPAAYVAGPPQKSPTLAGFFSAIMPGLGQIFCGLYGRGLMVFGSFVLLFSHAVGDNSETQMAVLVPSIGFVWFFGIFDAYRQANFQNWGWSRDLAASPEGTTATRSRLSNNLGTGVALLAVGLYGALRQFVDIDLSFLIDHWYLVALALGGYFVAQSIWGPGRQPAAENKGEAE